MKNFDPKQVRSTKKYFASKKQALAVADYRRDRCFKMKYGKHKGQYFVGQEIEYLNLY